MTIGDDPYTPMQLLNNAIRLLLGCGLYQRDFDEWDRKPAADKVWINLKPFIQDAYQRRLNATGNTSGQHGYVQNAFAVLEESDDDEDQHSYQTCSSGHDGVHSALFDSADSARFPQCDISPYVVNDPKFRLSWTMMTYGFNCVNANGEQRLQQSCLGIYKCPSTGCKFVQNAVAPRKNRVKYAKPMKAFGSDKCLIHGLVLVHIPLGGPVEKT
jgi:hypothetical protein